MAQEFGDQLVKEGYRGYFDLDFLIDEKDGQVYLGELNSAHLWCQLDDESCRLRLCRRAFVPVPSLEFSGLRYSLDVEELKQPLAQEGVHRFLGRSCDQMDRRDRRYSDARRADPESITWRDDRLGLLRRFDYNRQSIESEKEVVLPAASPAGRLSLPGCPIFRHPDHPRAGDGQEVRIERPGAHWIRGIKKLYAAKP